MVSRRLRGGDDVRRRGSFRESMHRILVVCEGRETERRYLESFRQEVRNPRVRLTIARETGVPLTVVTEAIRLKDDAEQSAKRERDVNLRYDDVWAVFDVDEHPKLAEACELADKNGIQLAVSNPCFELWALLHFQEQRAHIERHKARAAVQSHMPGYDKHLDFPKMHPGYMAAVRRAGGLAGEAARHGAPRRNPTTEVYRLTELIRSSS